MTTSVCMYCQDYWKHLFLLQFRYKASCSVVNEGVSLPCIDYIALRNLLATFNLCITLFYNYHSIIAWIHLCSFLTSLWSWCLCCCLFVCLFVCFCSLALSLRHGMQALCLRLWMGELGMISIQWVLGSSNVFLAKTCPNTSTIGRSISVLGSGKNTAHFCSNCQDSMNCQYIAF